MFLVMETRAIARGRPRKVADATANRTIHVMVGEAMFEWLNAELLRQTRNASTIPLPTRADVVRAIIQDAIERGVRLREMGEAAE